MSDDVILVGHGLPLPVLLLDVLLQVEAALLRNGALLKERLQEGRRRQLLKMLDDFCCAENTR